MTGHDLADVDAIEDLPPALHQTYKIIKEKLENQPQVQTETLARNIAEEREIQVNSARVDASEVLKLMEENGKATYQATKEQAIPRKNWMLTE